MALVPLTVNPVPLTHDSMKTVALRRGLSGSHSLEAPREIGGPAFPWREAGERPRSTGRCFSVKERKKSPVGIFHQREARD